MLDGLDEVRPHLQQSLYEAINSFYKAYFVSRNSGRLIVTCRKEAYRSIPIEISDIWEVVPLNDRQIQAFANKWPLGFPAGKSADGFWNDLSASPHILEVSRSPLLLVGSLLLYTESTLGIPGERAKYLQKIKNTLVEDWAAAQGHVPDPWRTAYTPILANIALQMQVDATAECPKKECVTLIATLLPDYGYEASAAADFLESLLTKTGILVRDVPGAVIFVQFTLQEYFASLYITNKYKPEELAQLARDNWWRETVLFAIAQQTDPSPYITALFEKVPMTGAMAVAEAPTVSLQLQETATELTLQQLDAGDNASVPPIVSLLRKVSGSIERNLCAALGERLENPNEQVAAIAGRVLATAGSSLATATLSQYPNAWHHCLDTSSFLSNTFEKLLFSWIETPAVHWRNAVDLLMRRREQDRLQMIDLLKKLPHDNANYLATAILESLHSKRDTMFIDGTTVRHLCQCLLYVEDKERLARELCEPPKTRTFRPGIVPTALHLAKNAVEANPQTSTKIFSRIQQSMSWCLLRSPLLLLLSSAIMLPLILTHFGLLSAYTLLIGASLSALVVTCLRELYPPWADNSFFSTSLSAELGIPFGILFCGVSLGLAVSLPDSILPTFGYPQKFYIVSFMIFVTIVGMCRNNAAAHSFFYSLSLSDTDQARSLIRLINNPPRLYNFIALIWLMVLIAELLSILLNDIVIYSDILAVVAVVIGGWSATQLVLTFRSWKQTRFAATKATSRGAIIQPTT